MMYLLPDCCTGYGVHGDSSVLELTQHRFAGRRVNLRQYFKLLMSPGIDSKESIQPAYAAWGW